MQQPKATASLPLGSWLLAASHSSALWTTSTDDYHRWSNVYSHVALISEAVVGVLAACVRGAELCINFLAVRPECREPRVKVGALLLEACLNQAQASPSLRSACGVVYKNTSWLMSLASTFKFLEVQDLGGKVLLERNFPEPTHRTQQEVTLSAPTAHNLQEFQKLDQQNLPLSYGLDFYRRVLLHAGLSRLASVDGKAVGSLSARLVRSSRFVTQEGDRRFC